MSYWNRKARLESLRLKKLKSQKIIRRALRGAADPFTMDDLSNIQIDKHLTIELFYENIGAIFPLVLNLVADGLSISKIEKLLGMNDRVLETILQRYPQLNERIIKARAIRSDDKRLEAMLS